MSYRTGSTLSVFVHPPVTSLHAHSRNIFRRRDGIWITPNEPLMILRSCGSPAVARCSERKCGAEMEYGITGIGSATVRYCNDPKARSRPRCGLIPQLPQPQIPTPAALGGAAVDWRTTCLRKCGGGGGAPGATTQRPDRTAPGTIELRLRRPVTRMGCPARVNSAPRRR